MYISPHKVCSTLDKAYLGYKFDRTKKNELSKLIKEIFKDFFENYVNSLEGTNFEIYEKANKFIEHKIYYPDYKLDMFDISGIEIDVLSDNQEFFLSRIPNSYYKMEEPSVLKSPLKIKKANEFLFIDFLYNKVITAFFRPKQLRVPVIISELEKHLSVPVPNEIKETLKNKDAKRFIDYINCFIESGANYEFYKQAHIPLFKKESKLVFEVFACKEELIARKEMDVDDLDCFKNNNYWGVYRNLESIKGWKKYTEREQELFFALLKHIYLYLNDPIVKEK